MSTDRRWQRTMIEGLDLGPLFKSAQLGIQTMHMSDGRSAPEVIRAVANIRAWRAYLPEACVTAMIRDGWQWST